MNTIEIGCESYEWEVDDGQTRIYDEEGDVMVRLRYEVKSEDEVRAAIYAYGQGRRDGREEGRHNAQCDIRRALGISQGEKVC